MTSKGKLNLDIACLFCLLHWRKKLNLRKKVITGNRKIDEAKYFSNSPISTRGESPWILTLRQDAADWLIGAETLEALLPPATAENKNSLKLVRQVSQSVVVCDLTSIH